MKITLRIFSHSLAIPFFGLHFFFLLLLFSASSSRFSPFSVSVGQKDRHRPLVTPFPGDYFSREFHAHDALKVFEAETSSSGVLEILRKSEARDLILREFGLIEGLFDQTSGFIEVCECSNMWFGKATFV